MPEFTQSWAFAFLLGCFIGGCFGFLCATILAASSQASRMEEKMEGYKPLPRLEGKMTDSQIYEAVKRGEARRGCKPNMEIATKNDPRTD